VYRGCSPRFKLRRAMLFRLQPPGRRGRDLNGQANPHTGGADVPDLPHCPYRLDGLHRSCAGVAHLGAPPSALPRPDEPVMARPSGSIRCNAVVLSGFPGVDVCADGAGG
jgi:hypothetical protein